MSGTRVLVVDRLPDGRERLHGDPNGYPMPEAVMRTHAPGLWAVSLVFAPAPIVEKPSRFRIVRRPWVAVAHG